MVVVLTSVLLVKMTELLEKKESVSKYADFFDQKEDFDVLFFGTSHMLNAVFPMELWNDYGIVSYNFGGHGNEIATSYWVMENALDYTSPKLVVFDCQKLGSSVKSGLNFSYLHLSFDAFKLSTTKIRSICDLLDDSVWDANPDILEATRQGEQRTKLGLLWDYSVYHSRWSEICEEDYVIDKNLEKGAESRINVTEGQLSKIPSNQKMDPDGSMGVDYLKRAIEVCQANNIEVLLTYLPFPANEEEQEAANYAYDLSQEYGVDYINFLDMDVIDYNTDLYDEDSHLNPSGARKVTDFLGKYILEHYNVDNEKSNPQYADWNSDYLQYIDLKNQHIKHENDIKNYLMLLSGDDIDVNVTIGDQRILDNVQMKHLLDNIGCNIEMVENADDYDIHIVVTRDDEIVDEIYYDTNSLYHN